MNSVISGKWAEFILIRWQVHNRLENLSPVLRTVLGFPPEGLIWYSWHFSVTCEALLICNVTATEPMNFYRKRRRDSPGTGKRLDYVHVADSQSNMEKFFSVSRQRAGTEDRKERRVSSELAKRRHCHPSIQNITAQCRRDVGELVPCRYACWSRVV